MNVVEDTLWHIKRVVYYLSVSSQEILNRMNNHDSSKFESPEKEMYEYWRPKLDSIDLTSEEYAQSLVEMGDGLKHHYENNRHHPEHFSNGIAGMNLIDLLEMACDWKAASERANKKADMSWASKRFGIRPDDVIYKVIVNTLEFLEEHK